ncbi:putative glutamine amidotransferase [Tumebacillus sp. BK434]|uniref:gamma-glutamyl-gamma-aminobutyrate hydrolase family protein n=1 Tax=Tumebacillus sp. BK434 TaxID=2512169 RepID=UPI00104510C7|nr:gamma-glutamyl-gamma-aminobutyrate hydrolase family protein [Tumebacillus sp. BK434]TCP55978.1 putative glutamine amidotransferase [Tumebacillus sp. BK434]
MQPLIGVTGYLHPYSREVAGVFVGEGYTNALAEAGAVPLAVPFLEKEEQVRALAQKVDGLLLGGGVDMDPTLFGEQPVPGNGEMCPERDWLEAILFDEMQKQGKPVLGICRGVQVINILLGGTIYQDLPSQKEGALFQHSQKAPRWFGAHHVNVKEGTKLHEIFGATRIRTNTYHHQAVRDAAPGLIVSGVADDGVIEAIERPHGPFLLGVQWHPENMWRKDATVLRLFEAFVAACK